MSAARRIRTGPIEGRSTIHPVLTIWDASVIKRLRGGYAVPFLGNGSPVLMISATGEHRWIGKAPRAFKEARA